MKRLFTVLSLIILLLISNGAFGGTIEKSQIGEQDIQHWDGVSPTFLRDTSYPGVQINLNKVGYEVDVLVVYGSGVVYNDTSITSALTSVGTNQATLVIRQGAWTLNSSIIIPSNIELKIVKGATLTIASGVTLTINGIIENHGIITGAGNFILGSGGQFVFGGGSIVCTGNIVYSGTINLNGLTWQGAYYPSTTYSQGAGVSYDGQLYAALQTTTGNLPTNTSYWTLFSGVPGTAGATWWSGSGVPSNSMGSNGDYYLNTATSDIYTMIGGSWGSPIVNIKGVPGVAGAAGAAGVGVTWRGAYVGGTTYAQGDGVSSGGVLYVSLSAGNQGNTPPNATYWEVFAGSAGPAGASGVVQIATAGGTVNAITATYSPAVTLADMTMVAFVASGANTSTTPSFAPNSLTAHTITKQGGLALQAGDIPGVAAVVIVEYNATNTRWELANSTPTALVNGTTVTTQSASDNSTKPASTAQVQLALGAFTPTMPVGSVLQVQYQQVSAYNSYSATIPNDNTIPQISEGTQLFSVPITPKSATDILKIEVVVHIEQGTGIQPFILALFNGSSNAIATTKQDNPEGDYLYTIVLTYYVIAGTTSPITFTTRGGTSSGQWAINGEFNNSANLGGTMVSTMSITEIKN